MNTSPPSRVIAALLLALTSIVFVGLAGTASAHDDDPDRCSYTEGGYDCRPPTETTVKQTTTTVKPTTTTFSEEERREEEHREEERRRRRREAWERSQVTQPPTTVAPAPQPAPASATPASTRSRLFPAITPTTTTAPPPPTPPIVTTTIPAETSTDSSLAAARFDVDELSSANQTLPWSWIFAIVIGLAVAISLVGIDRRWWSRH